MRKSVSPNRIVPGRWLVDQRRYAALQATLPRSEAQLIVSVTALDSGPNPVCTLAVACEHGRRTLELIAAFRIREGDDDAPSADGHHTDLAMYLEYIVSTCEFHRRVTVPFVKQMQSCGMY